jgi:uncharacterized protein involved in outer membrane biogenesis
MVLLQITGDEVIDIRCGVANFNVEHRIMKVDAFLLDTDVTKLAGTGSFDLANETFSLALIPKSKRFSLFALRGPIYVRGDLAQPDLSVDAGRVAVRDFAAVALAAISPALSLVALADPGSGRYSDCNALDKQAQAPWDKLASAEKHAFTAAPQGH